MDRPHPLENNEQFVADLKKRSKTLVTKLQKKEYAKAAELIHGLIAARDRQMFAAIAKLTRALHDGVVNLQLGTEKDAAVADEMTGHLRGVIDMMHNAADTTLDKIESMTPIATSLGQEAVDLQQEWARLKRREMDVESFRELYTRTDDFFSRTNEGAGQIGSHLQDIMLEQSYQDLTGQVLMKITSLATDIETELVNLMRMAQVDGALAEGEGSETTKEKDAPEAQQRKKVVQSQDDVDDLLSSLGF